MNEDRIEGFMVGLALGIVIACLTLLTLVI